MNVEQAPRKEVLGLIAGQARLRYELDDPTLAKADVDLGQPMTLKAGRHRGPRRPGRGARDVGLSYRVTEDGKLFITTAARLAEETGKKGAVIEGPPVKLTLSQPLKPSDPSYRELTRDAYARRLAGQGLREDVVQFILDQYGQALFEPKELIVLAHLSREAIDEAVLLDVFPPPKKFVRTALVVVHGVDPRLQDRARSWSSSSATVAPRPAKRPRPGSSRWARSPSRCWRTPCANKDVEIVFRAERLLLKLGRSVP